MDGAKDKVRGPDESTRGRDSPAPAAGHARRQDFRAAPLAVADSEPLTMDQVGRFFSGVPAPLGNGLIGEMVDENGPLAGRESARGKRKSGSLTTQFIDDDRPMLFAPNDAPDELPQRPTELDRLLRQQEFRERRRFMV